MNVKYAENYNPRHIPYILRINEIIADDLKISVLFSTGENRWLDYKDIFTNISAIESVNELPPAVLVYFNVKLVPSLD
jgi:hypothetical protein